MQELARLMEELTLALKARAEAGSRTEALAKEVQGLPKLSVLAPMLSQPGHSTEPEDDEGLAKLKLELELQDLRHTKNEGLKVLEMAAVTVERIRAAVNSMAASASQSSPSLDEFEARILAEKNRYAVLQQRKQDLLFDLKRKLAKLTELEEQLPAFSTHSLNKSVAFNAMPNKSTVEPDR